MSTLKWSVALVIVALVSAAASYRWAMHRAGDTAAMPTQANSTSATTPKGTAKILYYHDPMKPEVKFDKPGKSPFMDMDLVPVYANDDADSGGVAVSANAQQNLGIRMGRVMKAAIATQTTAVGSVAYDEHATAVVQARVAGYVTRLMVRATQDRVRRGQVLAEIAAPEWIAAQSEYLALVRSESAANNSLREAARQRLLVLGLSEGDIVALETSRAVLASTALRSPVDGVVTELGVRDGAAFEAGALLFRVNGTSTVWVNAQLPESQARGVAPGERVGIHATALPGETFIGRVQSILPQIDPATRTVGVRIAANNANGRLSPGMFVQTRFAGAAGEPRLWVPSEAVISTGERSVVIRKREDGSFDAVNVTLGAEADGRTVILSGLSEGEEIVLSGQFLIDSEANLKSAINRLTASPSANPEAMP